MHYYNFMRDRKQDKCIAHPSFVSRPIFYLHYCTRRKDGCNDLMQKPKEISVDKKNGWLKCSYFHKVNINIFNYLLSLQY